MRAQALEIIKDASDKAYEMEHRSIVLGNISILRGKLNYIVLVNGIYRQLEDLSDDDLMIIIRSMIFNNFE